MNPILQQQLKAMLKKSLRSLAAAQQHFRSKDYDFASSKAYYAVFHALQAVLLTKGLCFSKHSGVIGAFNLHFIKSGIFPKEFSRYLEQLFRDRQIGDYDYNSPLDDEGAEEDIMHADTIIKAIKKYLFRKKSLKETK